ncbi:MAG: CPBP family intramembrane metalloprotease [Clostridiales bacterium]|jgi:membrane protease YdiL (CAAX protease family)|nr:CPBP family intramembrane metalloprotease [Clostridiales bacterium]
MGNFNEPESDEVCSEPLRANSALNLRKTIAFIFRSTWYMPLLLLYSFLVRIALAFLPAPIMDAYQSDRLLPLSLILSEAILFLPPVAFYLLVSRRKPSQILKLKKLSLRNAGLIALMSVLLMPLGMAVSGITSMFWPNAAEEVLSPMSSSPIWISLLSVAAAPAFFEEISFRGALLDQSNGFGITASSLISGLFFGIMHMNPQQLPYTVIMGFAFALFVHRTGSLLSSMLAHFLFNSISLFLSQSIVDGISDAAVQSASPQDLIVIGGMAALFLALFFPIYRVFKRLNS